MNRSTDLVCSCKVGRNIERYDLEGLNDDLHRERSKNEASLRELADQINRQILKKSIEDSDIALADVAYGAVSQDEALSAVYETLTSDTIAADREAHVRKRLEQNGVNVKSIESDWVTHPTVRTHLKDCLNIDTSRSVQITPDDAMDTVEWARARCRQIIEQTMSRLVSSGHIEIADSDVAITISIECSECGRTYRLPELLDKRSCACTLETSSDAE